MLQSSYWAESARRVFLGFVISCVSVLFCISLSSCAQSLPDVQQDEPDSVQNLWTRQTGCDWPTFLGPSGNGASPETGILTDWRTDKLRIVWRKKLGEGYGMGSVSAGRYFHFDRHNGEARVRCFRAETGKELWEFRYPSNYNDLYGYDSGPRASPVVDNDRVYLFGVEGMLHCLQTDTGRLIWRLDTAKEFGVIQNFFGVASTPVIYKNLLLVMVGGSPPESQNVPPGQIDRVKPNGSGVVAFDKFTGKVRYRIADELASYATIKLSTLNSRPVALAWLRGSLVQFDPDSGEVIWEFPWRSRKLESVNASTPVVDQQYVFLSECYELGSVLLKIVGDQYEIVWSDKGKREKSMEAHWNTPVMIDGMIYGCSGRHSGGAELRCVEFLSGKVRWSQPGYARSSLTSIDGHLILLDEQGKLALLRENSDRFDLVTEFEGGKDAIRFKPPCWAAPIVSHGLMFVRGKDELVCFDLIPEIR